MWAEREPGSATVMGELKALLEGGHDGSLYIINARMLQSFPCAAQLEAIEYYSGKGTECAATSSESCTLLVLEAAVMKAAKAMKDSEAQEALIMLLSMVKLAFRARGLLDETKAVKASEPLKPCVPETLPGDLQPDAAPPRRMSEQHSLLSSKTQRDIATACQPASLPLWLRIRNGSEASSNMSASEQCCQRRSTSESKVSPQPTSPLRDRRAATPPHGVFRNRHQRPTTVASHLRKGSSIKGQGDSFPQDGFEGCTTLSPEPKGTFLHSSKTVKAVSGTACLEGDADSDDKGDPCLLKHGLCQQALSF